MTTLEERVASMPRLIPFRLAAACALALVLCLSAAAVAVAKGPLADLRVVDTGGAILAEDSFGAGTASVKTSPRADCFGTATGGSGRTVTVEGPTALGMLFQAARFTEKLKPLLVTDAFDFGLGLCGVGGNVVEGNGSWYLKVNHKGATVGGDSVKVRAGDEVLWYLAPGFPYPDELWLQAPRRATTGEPFTVRVFSYDEKGRRQPAAGATVSGAQSPTGADGRTTVVLSKPRRLIARNGDEIPSNRAAVCIGAKCPRG
jgi:hypothetical protein